jgi:hypothetical protein
MMFLLSAFCQKPVEGFRNTPMAGISPNFVSKAEIKNAVTNMERIALTNFIRNKFIEPR